MRQRELLEFRTPQHASFGTNNWGGASPLLARNIPRESLDQRYSRLYTVRDRDQVFPSAIIEDENVCFPPPTTIRDEIFSSPPPTTIRDEIFSFSKADASSKRKYPATPRRKWLLRKLMRQPDHKTSVTLGLNSGSRWFPKWNSKKRWPNGWC